MCAAKNAQGGAPSGASISTYGIFLPCAAIAALTMSSNFCFVVDFGGVGRRLRANIELRPFTLLDDTLRRRAELVALLFEMRQFLLVERAEDIEPCLALEFVRIHLSSPAMPR